MQKERSINIDIAKAWFERRKWKPFRFQTKTWKAYLNGYSGLLNAPTGTGKTYALVVPIALEGLQNNGSKQGLQAIWVTPLRALSKDIANAARIFIKEIGLDWEVAVRTGDTSLAEKQKIKKKPPQLMITTPETIHVLMAQKKYQQFFGTLKCVVIDEWHELMGAKRGVQVELALSRLKTINKQRLKVWGISATIGNLEEATTVLHGFDSNPILIKSNVKKRLSIQSIFPDKIEILPWAGHIGLKLLPKIIPIINKNKSTLIFTNTRAMAEIWYQHLLEYAPQLAGQIAMHHGSISKELRAWVEEALHEGKLKAVVCTSSLDLGVDFRPVDAVIQIGSPKGVARFIQRAGRSGHQPKALSKIYFVPTHALELVEAAALRRAAKEGIMESRLPFIRSFDVLIQYLMTLAVSDGFYPEEIYEEIKKTHAYHSISSDEWGWILNFIVNGGNTLQVYDEFQKININDGVFIVKDKKIARRHRLSIGTIVSDSMLQVKFVTGGRLGTIEEYFISRLSSGDVFWFSGRALELVRVNGMTVQVRRSSRKTGKIPSYNGGRMSLSAQLSRFLREKLHELDVNPSNDPELKKLYPIVEIQSKRSLIPDEQTFLVEYFKSKEGYHLLMFPFEGRAVHEGMSALMAHRISRKIPISFSIAMNDYGFELLSDKPLNVEHIVNKELFTTDFLVEDIYGSINAAEMARRKFRDIAHISGLIFQGFPGRMKKDRHLQSSAGMFFKVFEEYEPHNLLLKQAYEEVLVFQLEEGRIRAALNRIQSQNIVIKRPDKATPFAFPVMVDRMRATISSEKLIDRIYKLQMEFK